MLKFSCLLALECIFASYRRDTTMILSSYNTQSLSGFVKHFCSFFSWREFLLKPFSKFKSWSIGSKIQHVIEHGGGTKGLVCQGGRKNGWAPLECEQSGSDLRLYPHNCQKPPRYRDGKPQQPSQELPAERRSPLR